MSFILALVGILSISLIWLVYLAAIPSERVPRRPVAHVVGMILGLFSSGASLAVAWQQGQSLILPLLSLVITLPLAGLFFYLLRIAALPRGALRVQVGDRFIPFAALNDEGQRVRTESWHGQRVLLKFYRGHW